MPTAKKTTKKKTKKKVVNAKRTTTKKVVKKTATKKTVVKKPRRKKASAPPEDEPPLTPEEIAHFTQLLLEKRKELLGDLDHMQGEALDNNRQDSTGDLSNMPIHMADIGTDNYEQEFTLGLLESERKILREIDHALSKIQEGTYGTCEGTGTTIGRGRLEAKPEARYCVEYARMVEKGLVRPEEEDQEESA
jgi:RNA polymerase-binding protein DksA